MSLFRYSAVVVMVMISYLLLEQPEFSSSVQLSKESVSLYAYWTVGVFLTFMFGYGVYVNYNIREKYVALLQATLGTLGIGVILLPSVFGAIQIFSASYTPDELGFIWSVARLVAFLVTLVFALNMVSHGTLLKPE